MDNKKWYESKTVWWNVLAIVVLIANGFGFADFQLDAEVSAGILALVNLALRFLTNQGIKV